MSDSSLGRVSFIVLRHMRMPIVVFVCVYAICIIGMVLAPGLPDADGQTTYMSFFHAYYFLAYTATTTGFGELPTPFSNAQRVWAVVCLYISVITWLYVVGRIISLLRNPHLQLAFAEESFIRSVARKTNDYYLVCGFGDTGSLLLRGLTDAGLSAVVIELDNERMKALDLRDYPTRVLGLCADASEPRYLIAAGIESDKCIGVLILSNNEEANLKVAVSARILRPDLKVICRSTSVENESEILGLGGDIHVVDPFRVFASYMAMLIYNPTIQTLNEWLSGAPGARLDRNICPLKGGKWILCGHGRMGSVVYQKLSKKGIDITAVDPLVETIEGISEHAVLGRANMTNLKKAGLEECVGLIAGTDNDTFNLSMIQQVGRFSPSLFTIVRQNQHSNEVLFKKTTVDFILQPSLVIARMVLFMLTAPLLRQFFKHLLGLYESAPTELADLTNRLALNIGGDAPVLKTYKLNPQQAPAVCLALAQQSAVSLADIYRAPHGRDQFLNVVPMVHRRGEVVTVLPPNELLLEAGDDVLFCIKPEVKILLEANLANEHTLGYLLTGVEPARSHFFRWWQARSA
ncbi:MAG: NAD-binding protein [Cycloclasticus sp.]